MRLPSRPGSQRTIDFVSPKRSVARAPRGDIRKPRSYVPDNTTNSVVDFMEARRIYRTPTASS